MTEVCLPDIKASTRQSMQAFLRATNTAFGSRCQEHLGPNGLLGFCVSEAQWAMLPGNAVVDPENEGEIIIADRPTIIFTPPPELGALAANLKQYEITLRRNSAISEALRVLKNAIISNLPDADRNELSDPFFGLVSISCQQLLDHLRERYGTFLASDFDAFRTEHNAKIGMRTFSELSAQHRLIHVQFSSANQGLSEVDKCRYLRAAIGSNISYTTATTSYLTAHPHIAQQTFLGLVDHITEQAPNFVPVPIDLGYAASLSATIDTTPAYLESAAFAAYLDKRISAALPNKVKANNQGNSSNRPYCFKHGYNSHSSVQCRQMASLPEYTAAMKTANNHTDVANGPTHKL